MTRRSKKKKEKQDDHSESNAISFVSESSQKSEFPQNNNNNNNNKSDLQQNHKNQIRIGRIDRTTIAYFQKVEKWLDKKALPTDSSEMKEQRESFIQATWLEISADPITSSCHVYFSKVVEKLIGESSLIQLVEFLKSVEKSIFGLMINCYGSHVVEKLFAKLSEEIDKHGANRELIEVISRIISEISSIESIEFLSFDIYGTHSIRSFLFLLSGYSSKTKVVLKNRPIEFSQMISAITEKINVKGWEKNIYACPVAEMLVSLDENIAKNAISGLKFEEMWKMAGNPVAFQLFQKIYIKLQGSLYAEKQGIRKNWAKAWREMFGKKKKETNEHEDDDDLEEKVNWEELKRTMLSVPGISSLDDIRKYISYCLRTICETIRSPFDLHDLFGEIIRMMETRFDMYVMMALGRACVGDTELQKRYVKSMVRYVVGEMDGNVAERILGGNGMNGMLQGIEILEIFFRFDGSHGLLPRIIDDFAKIPKNATKQLSENQSQTSVFLDLCGHPQGSVLIETFITRLKPLHFVRHIINYFSQIPDELFITKLLGDKFGSHVVEKVFFSADLPGKENIIKRIEKLGRERESLPFYAKFVWKKLKVDEYLKKKEDWEKELKKDEKKKDMFDEIITAKIPTFPRKNEQNLTKKNDNNNDNNNEEEDSIDRMFDDSSSRHSSMKKRRRSIDSDHIEEKEDTHEEIEFINNALKNSKKAESKKSKSSKKHKKH